MSDRDLASQSANDGAWQLISDVLLSWLPFLIAFVSIPLAIYVPNLIEFHYDLSVILPFLGLGAISFLALFGIGLLRRKWRSRLSLALFFLGIFMLVSDIAVPLQWGLLDGESRLSEPWTGTVIEFGLAIVVIIGWLKLPIGLVRGFGVPLTFVLLVTQLFNLALAVKESSEHANTGSRLVNTDVVDRTAQNPATLGNVYHFVFDGYSGLRFEDDVRQLGLTQAMSGFTFFERTLANYHITEASIPSFLLGEFYKGGSFKDWQRSSMNGGLRRWLQESGFNINVYTPDRSQLWMYNEASYVRTSREISRSYFRGSDSFRLAQVAMVRVAPNFARREIFNRSDQLFGYVIALVNDIENPGHGIGRYGLYKRLSVPLIRQFLKDERTRDAYGNYVYLHVLLPHQPFVWDKECTYASRTSYSEQSLCATKLMGEIIELLKHLDRYDDSLIIFQSDHGYDGVEAGESNLDFKPPQAIKDTVHAEMSYTEIDGYFRRIHPLLAIKPPTATTPSLQVSQSPAQLIDIPATVVDLMGIDAPATDGRSVFRLLEGTPREIHLYTGVYTNTADGKTLVLGRNVSNTELAHVSYTPSKGWAAYPNLPAQAE